jgi:D-glycero-D-manno-heptose 1,7-bisphosphate phosphatase
LTRRAIFLDRDGVLNRALIRNGQPFPPQLLENLEILPGVEDACRDLRAAGFALVMVTNQPDVARGTQTRAVVEGINQYLANRLRLDAVKVCYHDDADNCGCRKPKPGLLSDAAQELNIDLVASFMIGDRWRDIEAGRRARCRTILVDSGHLERTSEAMDCKVGSLRAAADWILSQNQGSETNVNSR